MAFTRPKAAQIDFDLTNISDPLLRINSAESGDNTNDLGIVFERGNHTNAAIVWDESADTFRLISTTHDASTHTSDINISDHHNLTLKRITQSEQQYTTSNMMKFNQIYTGASAGSYFTQNEYQKILTITPSADSQNYQVSGRIMAQSAGSIQIVHFNAALRSETLPTLAYSVTYTDQHNGIAFVKPQLWHKQTTTAGFIIAFQYIHSSSLFGTVTVDIDVIPRASDQKSNVVMNTTQNSETTSVDTGFTAVDMTKIMEIDGDNVNIAAHDGSADGLELAGTLVTATAAELNLLDGASAGTVTASKAVIYDSNGGIVASGDINLNDADDQIIHGDTAYNQKQYVLYGTTTDATETEIFVGGTSSSRIPIASNTTVFYEANIVARRTDSTGEGGGWHLKAVADNFSGTVADVGDVYEVQVATDDANFAVDARADDTNDAVGIYVTGAAGKTIRWTAIVKTFEVAQ